MFVIGTAGHIDHGKSSLVQKLTGIDPDRLREEKERGMTIDLGFAWLKLPGKGEVGVIDVPGHERFIRNMLAGVGGIDLALLIVAANEGVMPQTREHLAIIDLLKIDRGIIVITKKDLVDEELLALVKMEVEELVKPTVLASAPMVAVSVISGEGLTDLVSTIDNILGSIEPRKDIGRPRLLIDRIFTIAGSGTVVTGTLIDGSLSVGQDIEVVPSGLKARVRGLQTHKTRIDAAGPGNRVAANLVGLVPAQLQRGYVVTNHGWLVPTTRIDVRLNLLKNLSNPLRHGMTVSFFSGAAEVSARVHLLEKDEMAAGSSSLAQLALEEAVAVVKGDRFIIRSPMDTLGGGVIINAHARKHRRFRQEIIKSLSTIEGNTDEDVVIAALEMKQPVEAGKLSVQCNLSAKDAKEVITELARQRKIVIIGQGDGAILFTSTGWKQLTEKAEARITEYHQKFPARQGMPKGELSSKLGILPHSPVITRLFETGALIEDGAFVRIASHQIKLSQTQQVKVDNFLKALNQNPYSPPTDIELEPDLLGLLLEQQKVVKAVDGVIFSRVAYDEMVAKILAYAKEHGSITLAVVRDIFGTSRKYAKAILEYMDEKKLTRRVGDDRVAR
jgi:selenocysteine-specific elongation factor